MEKKCKKIMNIGLENKENEEKDRKKQEVKVKKREKKWLKRQIVKKNYKKKVMDRN